MEDLIAESRTGVQVFAARTAEGLVRQAFIMGDSPSKTHSFSSQIRRMVRD